MVAMGIEAVRLLDLLLFLAFLAAAGMAASVLWSGPAHDVASGEPPAVERGPLMLWSSVAVLALSASVLLWALLPQEDVQPEAL